MSEHVHKWIQRRDGKPPRCACGADRGVIASAERAVIEAAEQLASEYGSPVVDHTMIRHRRIELCEAVDALRKAREGR